MARSLRVVFAALALAGFAACGLNEQQTAPTPTGPSTNGKTLTVQVVPDVLTQDGQSQSVVSIKAFGPNGQPLSAVALRAEIIVGGAITDFGALSARNVATDTNGSATVVYTAPPPVFGVAGATVAVRITPLDDKDFANANPVLATIRLVPPGIIGPPTSSLTPAFQAPAATVGDPATFVATITGTGAQPVALLWDFGDGTTDGNQTTTHTFQRIGTYLVTLSILDSLGRTNSVTHSVTVTQGSLPVASFTMSPPFGAAVGQPINFNASASTVEAGHNITDYSWNFGDGSGGGGQQPTHSYATAGTYTVTLQVTDDAGRKSNVASQTLSVGTNGPTASFTFQPSSPVVSQSVRFDASQSAAANGRTISSYAWTFDDGTTGSGVTPSHAYGASGSYNVTLTVTDSAGQSASTSRTVSVSDPQKPTASFNFSPTSPTVGQTINFDGSTSTAPSGRTITGYVWIWGDGTANGSGATPTHAYSAAGSYVVRLTVTDSAAQTSAPSAQTVSVGTPTPPTASFNFSPTSPTIGQTINFNGSTSTAPSGRTITGYVWIWGDGTAPGAGVTPTHAYSAAGSYVVTLTVTDSAGLTSAPSTQTVSVGTLTPPTASFTTSPANPIVGQAVNFNGSSSTPSGGRPIVTYTWNFGDGVAGSGVSVNHAYTAAGTYNATLTVIDSGGATNTSSPQTVSVSVPTTARIVQPANQSGPAATPISVTFDGTTSTAATGRSIVSYAWSFSDGGIANGSNPSHSFANPLGINTYTATLTVTDSLGGTSTTMVTFTLTGV